MRQTINKIKKTNSGFTLVEVVITIIIAGVLAAVALRSVSQMSDVAKVEETKQELEELEYAIVGNGNLYNDKTRSDFGYTGDVGALPTNLDALFSDPGGYATWKGPYVKRKFEQDVSGYKQDSWGTNYAYGGGVEITSTGSGSDIVRKFGQANSDFLLNGVEGIVLDIDGTPPGPTYMDSINITLRIPNGAGSYATKTSTVEAGGFFSFDSIPIGNHDISVIYLPNNDTIGRFVSVVPKSRHYGEYYFDDDLWTGSGSAGGGSSAMVIIRPNGGGSSSGNDDQGCSSNWQCVDESSPDGDGTYVFGGQYYVWTTDTYNATNPSVTGTIDSVKVFAYAKSVPPDPGDRHLRNVIRVGSTNYFGAIFDLAAVLSYASFSTTYLNNPGTSSAWSWSDINSLQIGVSLLDDDIWVTQIWAEIYYSY
jgi:prepilin-type N-terminal cleavage/methylation domain-containing protein